MASEQRRRKLALNVSLGDKWVDQAPIFTVTKLETISSHLFRMCVTKV